MHISFCSFTLHCKWLPTSVFYGHSPGLINQQIIQNDQKLINHHTFICMLSPKFGYDCAINTLGPVYPGQILQVKLFPPCLGSHAIHPVVFADTHNNHLPSTACKLAHQTELLHIFTDFAATINYTIVSSNTDMCELFLTIFPLLHQLYETFYVNLLE